MKQRVRRSMRPLLASILCFAMLLPSIGTVFAATTVDSLDAVRVGIDSTTKGHWEGNYGADTAILFAYGHDVGSISPGTDISGGLPVVTKDLVVQSDDTVVSRYNYWCAGNLWCYGAAQDDASVLDMPAGVTRPKFNAYTMSGGGDGLSNYRAEYEFIMTDSGYHLVTLYSNRAANDVIYVTFNDKETGELLLTDALPRGTFQGGMYVSYLVPGSFVMNMHKPQMDSGISAIFIDPVTTLENGASDLSVAEGSASNAAKLTWNETGLPAGATVSVERSAGEDASWEVVATVDAGVKRYEDTGLPAGKTYSYRLRVCAGGGYSPSCTTETAQYTVVPSAIQVAGTEVLRMGIDKTTKGHWEDKYGSDTAYLVGYQYEGTLSTSQWSAIDSSNDLAIKAGDSALESFGYDIGGNPWAKGADQNDESVLDMPAGVNRNKLNAATMSGRPGVGLSAYRATFNIGMADDFYHLISIYGNLTANGVFYITFEDKDTGETLFVDELPRDTFEGGAYITYLVPGSVTMYMDKPQMDFGFNALFIDNVILNATSALAVEAGEEPRSAKLTWTETDMPAGAQVIVERKTDGAFETVGSMNAGVGEYVDTNLPTGTTYTYRLRVVSGTGYSVPGSEVQFATVAYTATELTFDKELYTAGNANDTVTASVTLTSGDAVLTGHVVSLKADYGHMVQDLGTAVTTSEGVATFTFTPASLGQATLIAFFDDYDPLQLSHTTANAQLAVGEIGWSKAPAIWYQSDAVMPDGLINFNGYGFRNDDMTQMVVKYALHTADPSPTVPPADAGELPIVQTDPRDGYYLVTQLPATAEPGVYDIWVSNGYGWSEPVTLNAARPLFISEYEAWEGLTIKISGRNFLSEQFGVSSTTKVRLTNGTDAYEQAIIKNTPYSLHFAVNAPLGEYDVEVSNDNGITWKGLVTDQTLTVVPVGNDPLGIGYAWVGGFAWDRVFDVTDYGATGNDTRPDSDAFIAAMNAASNAGGGVVSIPAGNYYIRGLTIPSNIVLRGAGQGETTLYYAGTGENMFQTAANDWEGGMAMDVAEYQGFADFSVRLSDVNTRPDVFFWLGHPWDETAGVCDLRTSEGFFLKNIDLDYSMAAINQSQTSGSGQQRGYGAVAIAKERFVVQDSNFNGHASGITHVYVNEYSAYERVDLDYDDGYLQSVANYHFVEGCNITGGRHKSNSLDNHGVFGRAYCHMEDNYVEEVGSATLNDGEPFCVDAAGGTFDCGEVVNAMADFVTVVPGRGAWDTYRASYNRLVLFVTQGRGMGQKRFVDHIDPETDTIYIEGTWDVIPDATSKVTLISTMECVTIYNNEMRDSAKGIYLFGGIYDAVVANNYSVDTEGALVWSANVNPETNVPSMFATIRDNKFYGKSPRTNDVKIGVISQRMNNGPLYSGMGIYGIEIRDNLLDSERGLNSTNATEAPGEGGIVSWSALHGTVQDPNLMYWGDNINILIENNYLKDLDLAISSQKWDYGIVLKGNMFENVGTEFESTAQNVTQVDSSVTKANLADYAAIWQAADETLYTPESFEVLQDALAAANEVLGDENAATADVVLAMQELKYAAGTLKVIPSDPEETPDDPEDTPDDPEDTPDNLLDVSQYRSGEIYTAPVKEGCVFAGWYADAAFTTPLAEDVTTGTAYAKFVDENVLGVKWQISNGTNADSAETDIRLLTSVDTLEYQSVGFTVEAEGKDVKELTTKTVYRTIYGYVSGNNESYLPTIFSDASNFFMAHTLSGLPQSDFDTDIKVTPQWVTLDGTEVTGTVLTFKISDDAAFNG